MIWVVIIGLLVPAFQTNGTVQAADSGEWTDVGGKSNQNSLSQTSIQMRVDSGGTPYLLVGGHLKKYINNEWEDMGDPFYDEGVVPLKLAKLQLYEEKGQVIPYVLYDTLVSDSGLHLVKQIDGKWIPVGANLPDDYYESSSWIGVDFAITAAGTPYVLFHKRFIYNNAADSNDVTLYKYTGPDDEWTIAADSNTNPDYWDNTAEYAVSIVSSGETLYMNFTGLQGPLKVMSYDDTNKLQVLSNENPGVPYIRFGPLYIQGNKIYTAWVERINSGGNKYTVRVKSYNMSNQTWTDYENPVTNVSGSNSTHGTVLVSAGNNGPIISYNQEIFRYFDGSWIKVGGSLPNQARQILVDSSERMYSLLFIQESQYYYGKVMSFDPYADFRLSGSAKDRMVLLDWTAYSGADFYVISWGEDSEHFTNSKSVISNTAIINGLTNNTTYYFKIQAYGTGITGDKASNIVSLTPQAAAPAVPRAFRTRASHTGTVEVSWQPVLAEATSSLSDAVSYNVYYSKQGTTTESMVTVQGPNNDSQTITGLDNGALYAFQIQAVNDTGASNRSATRWVMTGPDVWEPVGEGIGKAQAGANSLFVYNGTPYVSFFDTNFTGIAANTQAYRLTVKKYDGTGWVTVGQPGFTQFTSTGIDQSSNLFVYQGVPYVIFQSFDDNKKAYVMKYNGKNWEVVGGGAVSGRVGENPSLYVDESGIYAALGNEVPAVYKFTQETGWQEVGSMSTDFPDIKGSSSLSVTVDQGKVYLSFRQHLNRFMTIYDGEKWVKAGDDAFARFMDSAVYGGTAYQSFTSGGIAYVNELTSDGWRQVGKGTIANKAETTQMMFYKGTPYFIYLSSAYDFLEPGKVSVQHKPVVMRYTGKGNTGWEMVGTPAFSFGNVDYVNIAGDETTGTIYVSYSDSNYDANGSQVVVQKFYLDDLAPAVPLNVSAIARNGEGKVSWSKVPEADSYNLYIGLESGEYGTPLSLGEGATGFTALGLDNDQTYYYAVSAVRNGVESGKSVEVSATPWNTAAPPLVGFSVAPGSIPGSTSVTAVVYQSVTDSVYNQLHLLVSPVPVNTPDVLEDQLPEGTVPLESGVAKEVTGVAPGQYIAVYETSGITGAITRFDSQLLQRGDVLPYPAGVLAVTAQPGSSYGTTSVTSAVYNTGDTFRVKVYASGTVSEAVYKGDTPPQGAAVYTLGASIGGVSAGSTVALYEVDANKGIVAYGTVVLTADQINQDSSEDDSSPTPSLGGGAPVPATENTGFYKLDKTAALEALKDSTKAALELDLADTAATDDGKKTVTLPADVIAAAKEEGKSIVLKDGGAEWSVPANALAEGKELTLTLGSSSDAPANVPTALDSKLVYHLTVLADNQPLDGLGDKIAVKLPVPADAKDAAKLVVYKKKADGTWEYAGSRIVDGKLVLATDEPGEFLVAESTKTFADISSHWAKRTVEIMAARQIADGVTENEFAPDSTVNRAEFAALLTRILGLPTAATAAFTDVAEDAWYKDEVSAAAAAGIIEGDAGNFRPAAPVTRQEMAIMILRAYQAAGLTAPAASAGTPFTDNGEVADWAQDAVAAVYGLGIIEGNSDGTFAPAAEATRAEGLTMLLRLMDKTGL